MTEKVDPNSKYYGHLTYSGKFRDHELTTLGFYLQGKPNQKGWRDIFAYNHALPVEHQGRIFPDWAVEDARVLIQEDPQTIIRLLAQYNLSLEDLPPLD